MDYYYSNIFCFNLQILQSSDAAEFMTNVDPLMEYTGLISLCTPEKNRLVYELLQAQVVKRHQAV
jgi:hypothetical protein